MHFDLNLTGTPVPLMDPACDLLRQAAFARASGVPFVANVLEAGFRQLDHAPRTSALIHQWQGNAAEAALAMRFNAALHWLARQRRPPALAMLYAGRDDDFDGVIAATLQQEDSTIANLMGHPTQTNEVARSAAILGGLMELAADTGMPCELLELGASSGLNLNLMHYTYDLGGLILNPLDPASADDSLLIAPRWHGPRPRMPAQHTPLQICSARGVDLHPGDPADPQTVQRLMSYVWAHQPERSARLARALELAWQHTTRVDKGDALDWLAARFSEPQAQGVCRVIFHSMFRQYLDRGQRQTMEQHIHAAGREATVERPLAWMGYEWTPDRSAVHLDLTTWPGGKSRHLATCDVYGAWVDWHAA